MNIGFDAKRLFLNYTGLGNYSRFIVESLARQYPDNRYKLFTPKRKHAADTDFFFDNNSLEIVEPPSLFPFKSLWRTVGISFTKQMREIDIYHGLSAELPILLPKKLKKIVTVHDLIFMRYPEYYNLINRSIYISKVKHACEEADSIISISQQTANDLIEFLNIPKERIKVVYQGCHNQFKQMLGEGTRKETLKKYSLPEKYILNVGTIEPRKNLLQLIRAINLIPPNERIPVVVIGRTTPYYKRVREEVFKFNLENSVRFIHGFPFADLPALYQSASVFVYPSLFEGFGIPIVEAIESCVPVITSKGSCFKEAGGDDTIYVDPNSPQDLAMEISRLILDGNKRESVISKSRIFAEKFQPQIIGRDIMDCYHALR